MLRRIVRALRSRRTRSVPDAVQSGAIPYAWSKGEPVYLLVTSRRSGRWIFPKGELKNGETGAEAAAREALEEAGVEGRIEQTPLGAYQTLKIQTDERSRAISVALYALEVQRQRKNWSERGHRRRRWATWRQARRMIDNPDLRRVLKTLHEQLTAR